MRSISALKLFRSKTGSQINLRADINWIYWYVLLLLFLGLCLPYLDLFKPLSTFESVAFVCICGSRVAAIVGIFAVFGHFVGIYLSGTARIIFDSVSGLLMTLFLVLDIRIFRATGFHLEQTFEWVLSGAAKELYNSISSKDRMLFFLFCCVTGFALASVHCWTVQLSKKIAFSPFFTIGRIIGVVILALAASYGPEFSCLIGNGLPSLNKQLRYTPLSIIRMSSHSIASFSVRIKPLKERQLSDSFIASIPKATNSPDIFIFILESLRADVVNSNITPNLNTFAQSALYFQNAVAGGNATQLSWYSIFSAQHSIHFGDVKRKRELWGTIPLRLFQRLGYQTLVYSGADLTYYDMDRVLFGPQHELATSIVMPSTINARERYEADRRISELLIQNLKTQNKLSGGRLFIVFFDSTHYRYFWPPDTHPKFNPYSENWVLNDLNKSAEDLAMLKNRYFNSLNFVDSLLGQILEALESSKLADHSIIVVTGDHGEEFYEYGNFLHANEFLSPTQTTVPLMLKLPGQILQQSEFLADHISVLPTILNYLGVKMSVNADLLDGEPIGADKTHCSIVAAGSGGADPFDFCLINGKSQRVYLSLDPRQPRSLAKRTLIIRRITDATEHDINLGRSSQKIKEWVIENFRKPLNSIFEEIE